MPGVAVDVWPWVGEGVTNTVGVPSGGSVAVAVVVGAALTVGATTSVAATVAVALTVELGSAATAEGVALGCDPAWAQAISSNVANAARTNQAPLTSARWLFACSYERTGRAGLRPRWRRCDAFVTSPSAERVA